MSIAALSDSELLSQIQSVLGSRNRLTAKLLAYLAEVEARRLELKEAYSSIYDFCLRKLGFSEGSAVRHIAAARACRRFPVALQFVQDGQIHLTGMALLSSHLTDANHLELLSAAAGRSKAEIEMLIRTRFPRSDVPESVRPVLAISAELTPGGAGQRSDRVGRDADGIAPSNRGRVAPLSADRFHAEFTMTAATKDKLDLVLDLMSHSNPKRSLVIAFERALDVLLRDLEKKRLGKTAHPRKSRGVKHGNIARSTLRGVYERDGVQCAFVSEAGARCTSRVFLQTDHVVARAQGGSGKVNNARVLCQPHNLFEAEQTFGAGHVARKIRERRERLLRPRDEAGATTRIDSDASGIHRRQERLKASAPGNVPRARCSGDAIGNGREASELAPNIFNSEVRAKLLRALTQMGFRRGETASALRSLEQRRPETYRTPLETLIREALALLTR